MAFLRIGVAVIGLLAATAASAQTPSSVKALLIQGYRLVSVMPITGSYAFFLEKDSDLVICQVGFDQTRKTFATEQCYTLAN